MGTGRRSEREREPRNRSRSRSLGAAHTNKTHDLNWRERERGRARRRMQNIMYWMASHTVVLWCVVQCVSLSICRWCDHLSVWRTHFSLTFSLLSLALLIYSFNVSFCFFFLFILFLFLTLSLLLRSFLFLVFGFDSSLLSALDATIQFFYFSRLFAFIGKCFIYLFFVFFFLSTHNKTFLIIAGCRLYCCSELRAVEASAF